MHVSLTVGRVDAGLAILLTENNRLIEFPSALLPKGITSGSIVDIEVSRNTKAEQASRQKFIRLQEEIYELFGKRSPSKPQLRIRNATQTSVVLEWDRIDLATATLRSLTLFRNNSKAGAIPNPTTHTSTKISGLAVDHEYYFHLVLKTSAGTFTSEKVTVRTHKMTDLSGITVCPGIMAPEQRDMLDAGLKRIGAKPMQDFVKIDTTHFVCTEGRGQAWERAVEMNIPVVRPEWVTACEREGRIVGVRLFYLNADPKLRPQLPDISPNPSQYTQQTGQSARTEDGRPRREEVIVSPPHQQQQHQQLPPVQEQQLPQPPTNPTPPLEELPKEDTSKAQPPLPESRTPEPVQENTSEARNDRSRSESPEQSERLGTGSLGTNREAAMSGEGFESVQL